MAPSTTADVVFDGVASPEAKEALGYDVCKALAYKGFCTVDLAIPDDDLSRALAAAKELHKRDYYMRPAEPLQIGMLGPSGSSEIAEFTTLMEDEVEDGAVLRSVDSTMSEVVYNAVPHFQEMLGFEVQDRTLPWLHRSESAAVGEPEALSEKVAAKWINCFARQRLMCLLCLGTKGGIVELCPLDGESAPIEVVAQPGVLVVFRADRLRQEFKAYKDGDYVMTSWYVHENKGGVRGALNTGLEPPIESPGLRALVDWAWEKLQITKTCHEEGQLDAWDSSIPRGWQMAANRRLMRGTQVAVHGYSFNYPGKQCEINKQLTASLVSGCDNATAVPINRWDHSIYYDHDPLIYTKNRHLTAMKHCCHIDGVDLFDNKFFGISNLEAKVMEPIQKHTIEAHVQALDMAGYTSKGDKTKTKMMGKFIGIFSGAQGGEFLIIPHERAGGCAGSEGSPAIIANRISFIFGLMGPSFTIQLDSASALGAIYEACIDSLPTPYKDKPLTEAVCATGVYMMLTPFWWPLYAQWMDIKGRSCTFDADAQGYIRADGSGTICCKRYGEKVDGQFVYDPNAEIYGCFSGWGICTNGMAASLSSPNGLAQQMVLTDTLRLAGISPLDVDAVMVSGMSNQVHDAVEVVSLQKVLRNCRGAADESLALMSSATRSGNSQESMGMLSIMSSLQHLRHGISTSLLHFKQLNPYIDTGDAAIHILTEALSLRCQTSFVGCTGFGLAGTNVHLQLMHTRRKDEPPERRKRLLHEAFGFWPAGGGPEKDSVFAVKGYSVIGSWSCWEDMDRMTRENESTCSFVATLGENRYEEFQIVIDDDPSRTLHPDAAKASSGSAVVGPAPASEAGNRWLIDGRPKQVWLQPAEENVAGLVDVYEMETSDTGRPGDQYQVQLHMAGKWLSVTWHKLPSRPDQERKVPRGSYSLIGDWNNWDMEEMELRDETAGLYELEICLLRPGGFFQIVRNKDFSQTFFPRAYLAGGGEADGPAEANDNVWCLEGKPGDVFRIRFKRWWEGDVDRKEASWEVVGFRSKAEELERRAKSKEGRASERRAQEEREAAELEASMRS